MPRHSETKRLPFTPEQLFELVADVGRYPEFLPWCKAARVLERRPDGLTADLIIGYKMFSERFRSEVTLDHPHSISIKYVSGPLSHLSNEWRFKAVGKQECDLSFDVDFDFNSPILRAAIELFFDKALRRMVTAFETRARQLYG